MFRSCLLAMLLLTTGTAAYAQQSENREIRVSAKPYTPASRILRVESDLVEVGVVVRGKDGRTIAGLKREDFEVLDQGKPQVITHFAMETAAAAPTHVPASAATPVPAPPKLPPAAAAARVPRFVALYFDDYYTASGHLKRAQAAARRYIAEGLDPGDRAAIFSSSSGRLLDYTGDRSRLLAAIDKLVSHPLFSENGLTSCPRITPYQSYLITVAFDTMALNAAVDEARACSEAPDDGTSAYVRRPPGLDPVVMQVKGQAEITWNQARAASQSTLDAIGGALSSLAGLQGRRLLLLVSSGFLGGTLERQRDQMIDRALRANIVINAMDAKGLYVEAPGRPINEMLDEPAVPESTFHFEAVTQLSRIQAGTDVLAEFAESTGGLFFHNNNDLASGFHQLGALPSVSYILAFRPGELSPEGSYHRLKVRLTSPSSYVIEARPGYFAPFKESADHPDRRSRLDREVAAESELQEIPIAVTYQPGRLEGGAVSLRVQIHIEIADLQFPKREDRRLQQFRFVVALLDPDGNIAVAKEGTMDFALTDATYTRLSGSGVNAGFTLESAPGKYRLRVVVQEAEGKLASSLQSVELP